MRRPLALALLAAMLVVGAGALSSHALFAAGAGLAIATSAALVCVAEGARTVAVSTRVPVREAEEGSVLTVFLSSPRRARRPLRVEALVAGEWRALEGGETAVAVRLGSRGPQELSPVPVRLTDPLGLAERRIRAGEGTRVLALPRPEGGDSLLPTGPHGETGTDPEPAGVRPYVPGTPISRIDWRSLARGGELMQRDLTHAPADAVPLVIVDTRDAVEREDVDRAARAAADAVTRLAPGGVRVLLPGDRNTIQISPDLRRWPDVHRRLALLEAGAGATPPEGGDRGPVVSIRARPRPSSHAARATAEAVR